VSRTTTSPVSPAETTPEQLASRYGKVSRTATVSRRVVDMVYSVKVYGYPERGFAFTQVRSDRIENKFLFPPSAELPFGLR
jgi:hypothetical protein